MKNQGGLEFYFSQSAYSIYMVSTLEKIRILGANSRYDICASTASSRTDRHPTLYSDNPNWIGNVASAGICHSYTPDGRCVSLFKTLFTNKCIYSCKYCFSQTCKQKVSFTPEEYARTFMKLYAMNVVEGVFISSGINGDADETTKDMIETIRLLRYKYHFRGYVHFKCLPAVSAYLIKEAVKLSDRISINLEASTKEFLEDLAEQKNYNTDILTRQRWLKEIRIRQNEITEKILADLKEDAPKSNTINSTQFNKKPQQDFDIPKAAWTQYREDTGYRKYRWDGAPILNSGHTTQLVIGAAEGESDNDILKRLDWEYREMDLRRGYFSAFIPIKDTPLESSAPAPLEKEHRLYQTDWLLRIYHFRLKDIKGILTNDMNLPSGDPKIHLAREYFGRSESVDPNTAPYRDLIRVPGIGPTSAKRIINMQKSNQKICSRAELKAMGVVLKRADTFLKINGLRQQTLKIYS